MIAMCPLLFVILVFHGASSLDCPQCFHAAWRESNIPEQYRATADMLVTRNTNFTCANNEVPARPCPAGWNNTCGTASIWFTGQHFPFYAPDADVSVEMVSRLCLPAVRPESCVSVNNYSMFALLFIPDKELLGEVVYTYSFSQSEYVGQFCYSTKGLPVQLHINSISSGERTVMGAVVYLSLALMLAKTITL